MVLKTVDWVSVSSWEKMTSTNFSAGYSPSRVISQRARQVMALAKGSSKSAMCSSRKARDLGSKRSLA